MTQRDIALDIAKSFLGTPYIWGGNDPVAGFDCSGFIIEVLKSVGSLPREGDWTADMLSEKWRETAEAKPGCLMFWDWNKDGKIDHVEMIIEVLGVNNILTIGASGGNNSTVSLVESIEQDAYIKIRPARLNWESITDPFITQM